MVPSIGRIVLYKLSGLDANRINVQSGQGGKDLNRVTVGDVFPMVIVKVHTPENAATSYTDAVNGQLLIDGNFNHWLTSRGQGFGYGQWHDPREEQA